MKFKESTEKLYLSKLSFGLFYPRFDRKIVIFAANEYQTNNIDFWVP